MIELVHIPKVPMGDRARGANHGRPARVDFALRNYGTICLLALPRHILQDGDGAEFFGSSDGFAIQLSPNGTRKLSNKRNTFAATLPLQIRTYVTAVVKGSITVPHTEMPDRTYFFAYADIEATAANK